MRLRRKSSSLRLFKRRGLTLYEVLLAFTIFAMALAALGQLISVGVRAGGTSRLRTEAVFRCESKLAEIISGVETQMNGSDMPFSDGEPGWTWSAQSSTATQADLLDLIVTVNHTNSQGQVDATFTLRRLFRDPVLFLDAAVAAQAEASSTGGTSGSTGGTSTGGGSSSSGGSSNSTGGTSGGAGGGDVRLLAVVGRGGERLRWGVADSDPITG